MKLRLSCRVLSLVLLFSLAGMDQASEPLKIEAKRKPGDNNWKTYDTWTLSHAAGFQRRAEPSRQSQYGGDASRRFDATGFFHSKKVAERWMLVDPDGHPFIHIGICSVKPIQGSDEGKSAFRRKFGSGKLWAAQTMDMLRSNGFNGSGSWSDDTLLAKAPQRPSYCPNWNFMSSYGNHRGVLRQKAGHKGYPNEAILIFDPEFETFAMEHAAKLVATKNDPWLLGHFSDNELPVYRNSLDNFLSLPKEEHGYKATKKWLEQRKGGKFDAAKLAKNDREAFIEFYMDRYFSIVSKAIRAHDPNHLYLGCRYHGQALTSPGAFQAAGRHCDVVSLNYYGAWSPDFKRMQDWVKWSGKPFMVTEFYAKGVDSGMPNTSGAGWLVKTQKERGLFYQNFCIGLMQSKGCVGWHHFKYIDNDLNNKNVDPSNIDSNKGVISSTFEPYPDFLRLMKEININVYDLMEWMDQGGSVHPK